MEQIRLVSIKTLRPLASPAHGGSVQTEEQGELQVGSAEDWAVLQFCQAQGELAAIRFDPQLKQLTLAWPADEDAVAGVGPADDGNTPRVVVRLLKRPTLLYLARHSDRFGPNLALLREAMSSRREVAVAVFPGGGEIDDVRLMPKR